MADALNDVLLEAHELIRGDRQKDYGPPTENFDRIAKAWSAYLIGRDPSKLTMVDVCMMMVILKAVRMTQGFHRDSAIDIGGYAGLSEVVHQGGF